MCGIVGYFGPENPKEVLLKGLKTLEYRGYDSAGVAILHEGRFKRVRAEGKLSKLEEKLSHESFDGRLGIGHTRWATHGPPSERNAHPHVFSGVSIVHNGIIENHTELRDELRARGAKLESDTDSELVAHLIADELRTDTNLLSAVQKILPKLRGAYSILAVSQETPDEMVAFKNGPPLVVGATSESVIVASDVQAIMPYTQEVVFLEDNDVLRVRGTEISFFDRNGKLRDKSFVTLEWSPELVEKQGFSHFMLKEIFEQPRAVAAAIEPHVCIEKEQVKLSNTGFDVGQILADCERVFIIACGTSYYAGLAGEYMIERLARVPVECDIASEFRYRYPVIPDKSLVIVISQSGETADTLAALRIVKSQSPEIKTLSICNVKNSSIDREAEGHLYMNAGVEIGVASTKAFSSTISLLSCIAIAMAKSKGRLKKEEEQQLTRDLISAPAQMEKVLNYDKFFDEAAHQLKGYKGFLYMGRGIDFPIALEGALKLKELAYMHAEGYAAGEMKHGPLALIDPKMAIVMLAPDGELYEKTLSNLEEAKARGGQIISIGTGENAELKELSETYLSLPEASWLVNPLLEVIPLQLLAFHVADSLGHDVDQPRNLAKSVTVE